MNMLFWAIDAQSNRPNRIYSLNLPPLLRPGHSHRLMPGELNPQREIRVQIPSRHSVQNNNDDEYESESRSRPQLNNRGVSVNRRMRLNVSRQSRQHQNERVHEHSRSESIPAHFRVQHRRNVIPNPANVQRQVSPEHLLNLVLGIENGEMPGQLNNIGLGHILLQPGRIQPNQNSLSKQEMSMLPKTSHSGKEIECSICLDSIVVGDEVRYLVCFHCFHEECCIKWMQKSVLCPVCKINVRQHLHQRNQQQ